MTIYSEYILQIALDDSISHFISENLASWRNVTNEGEKSMDCPWYLGFEATEECIKTCTITKENRNNSVCPESASEYDDYVLT